MINQTVGISECLGPHRLVPGVSLPPVAAVEAEASPVPGTGEPGRLGG
jgi:hypothetical protein